MSIPLDILCRTGAHCAACRRVGPDGDRFRAGLAAHYALPEGWPACPYGVAMGADRGPAEFPPPPPAMVPDPMDGTGRSRLVVLTVGKTREGFRVEEPPPASAGQMLSYGQAVLTARRAPPDVTAEREATCRACEYARYSARRQVPWCSRCGCSVGGEAAGLLKHMLNKLTEVEENLPKWGCHHPRRDQGMGWRR